MDVYILNVRKSCTVVKKVLTMSLNLDYSEQLWHVCIHHRFNHMVTIMEMNDLGGNSMIGGTCLATLQ